MVFLNFTWQLQLLDHNWQVHRKILIFPQTVIIAKPAPPYSGKKYLVSICWAANFSWFELGTVQWLATIRTFIPMLIFPVTRGSRQKERKMVKDFKILILILLREKARTRWWEGGQASRNKIFVRLKLNNIMSRVVKH